MPASASFSGRFVRAVAALILPLAIGACSEAARRIERDPYFETFFEKTRLIMTAAEIEIYRHLPDNQAKEGFIEEFWLKRDPNPQTEENENKLEFERRIEYANRWFKENRQAGHGWKTPRGRILLQLGEPDNRVNSGNSPYAISYEYWRYDNYQIILAFVDRDGFGEYEAFNWPPELLTAIDKAKDALLQSGQAAARETIVFDAAYKNGAIVISLPTKHIRFKEDGESIHADFKITVTAYRNYAKDAVTTFAKRLSYQKGAIPGGKTIAFSLPFPLSEKGRYCLEVIVEEALSGSRARDFVDFKL